MKIYLHIITASLLVAGFVYASDSRIQPYDVDTMYLKASMYDNEKNYDEAAQLYEKILENIDSEYVYEKLAQDYAKLNDIQSMKLTLERGLRHNPDSAPLLGLMGDVYAMNEDTVKKSFEMYQKAYDKSKEPIFLVGMANAYVRGSDYNSAISIYDQLLSIEKNSEYYISRGKLYEMLGLEKESIADYQAATELDGNFSAASRLADYYLRKNDTTNAIKYLKIVIAKSPDNVVAKFRLAEIFKKIGQQKEAKVYYNALLSSLSGNELDYVLKQLAAMSYSEKDYASAYEYFMRAYDIDGDMQTGFSAALMAEASGDNDSAMQWYQKLLKKRSDFIEVRKRLAIIYLKENNADSAVETLSGVDKKYMDVEYYRILAEAYNMKKDDAKAEQTLMDALNANDKDIKVRLDLAIFYDEHGKSNQAAAILKDGLKIYPDNESFLNFLGYMYAEQGINLSEAKTMVQKALAKKPNDPAFLDSMGWVLFKQGKYKQAYDFQKKAVKFAPDEKDIRDHMQMILDKLGSKKSVDDVIKEN